MKKILILLFTCMLSVSLTACGDNTDSDVKDAIVVPDIKNADESTAKDTLSNNGLITNVKYENSDDVERGNVIRTEPEIGTEVQKDSEVTIYVSDGPSYIEVTEAKASDSKVQWVNLSSSKDDWQINQPYIENGILYIECSKVTFGCDMVWKDEQNEGKLSGMASLTSNFDKSGPVSARYEKQSWNANESQSFTLEIPLEDLQVSQPTDICLRLYTNRDTDVRVDFSITW